MLRIIVRCPVNGYWQRGMPDVFAWLRDSGLIVSDGKPLWAYYATDAGRAELAKLGYCTVCGGHGSVQVADGLGIRWQPCRHPRLEKSE